MKYKRRNAIINRDEACIPPVSEKKSTINPYRKAQNKMMNLFLFKGNKKINVMYKYGLILPEKLMLFNTNIWRNRIKNSPNKYSYFIHCCCFQGSLFHA